KKLLRFSLEKQKIFIILLTYSPSSLQHSNSSIILGFYYALNVTCHAISVLNSAIIPHSLTFNIVRICWFEYSPSIVLVRLPKIQSCLMRNAQVTRNVNDEECSMMRSSSDEKTIEESNKVENIPDEFLPLSLIIIHRMKSFFHHIMVCKLYKLSIQCTLVFIMLPVFMESSFTTNQDDLIVSPFSKLNFVV
ncbi:hypothetical protein L9F63_002784, partial [Diploptera punctata]